MTLEKILFSLDAAYPELTEIVNGEVVTLSEDRRQQTLQAWAQAQIESVNTVSPVSVTMAALRLALGRDVCIQIGAYIASIPDVNARWQTQTWWEFSPRVNSDHPVVEQFRVALNKTYKQISDWFQAAQAIDEQ